TSELAGGLLILHSRRVLDAEQVNALCGALDDAGVVQAPRDDDGEIDYPVPAAELLALPWLPPTEAEAAAQRAALERIGGGFDVDHVWCVMTETCIDAGAGRWRFGPPPLAEQVDFPVEGYPEIHGQVDRDDFGIALKLGGPRRAGEELVVRVFHRHWLAPYFDMVADAHEHEHEHGEDCEHEHHVPFRHADVEWDEVHRACALWVDHFDTPADDDQLVHHLLWVAARIAEVMPVVHARFRGAEPAWKFRSLTGDDSPGFVLAGNPLRARYLTEGEPAVLAWAESQKEWSPAEVAAMLAETVEDLDPEQPEQRDSALRLCERALALDPGQRDALGYLVQLLVWAGRFDDALARVRAADDPPLAVQLLGVTAAHAPERLADALAATPPIIELIEDLAAVAHDLGRSEAALAVYRRLLEIPLPDEGDERGLYQRCTNNACVIAHALGHIDEAVAIADAARPWAAENPYIFHSAACAYAATGDLDRAFAQCELAVRHGYPRLDALAADTDLGALREQPRFTELFTAWHAGANPPVDVDDDGFDEQVITRSHRDAVLVDFWAEWCGPCRMLGPVLEQVARDYKGKLVLAKVDVDANQESAARFEVSSIPAVKLFIDGEVVDEFVGAIPLAQVRAFLARHLD
ncbi:MAG TPA: thioredoxin, partial [Kofleriaceae bacterium]|nr:thioredoxin [Kofleriaceae bacterium]